MRVGQITADNQRPEGYALTEQRLDETEVGEGTAITLINATRPSEWKQTNNPYDCAEWLGTNQMIYPGEVNWMIAGRGVTHSERTSAATRAGKSSLFGIQTWVALPDHAEETDAQFEHHGKDALPLLEGEGKAVRLIQGTAWGAKAPVKTFTDMFYADVVLEPGAALPLPDNHEDRGLYITQGAIEVAGERFESGRMMVFRPGDAISVRAGDQGARLMLLGGETLSGPRYIWWNFVASSQEKIDAARDAWANGDWAHGRFHLPPGDDREFIPLPE